MIIRTKVIAILQISALVILMVAFAFWPAFAGGSRHNDEMGQDQKQGQIQGQAQGQKQVTNVETKTKSEAIATAGVESTIHTEGGAGGVGGEGGNSAATNEGITVDASENSNIENNSSNVVLVPNNNTEKCLRVFGFAFGTNGDSAAFGIPWRSGPCDVEQAADDAFAGGEREIGWFWKCQNKNLYKKFKGKGETTEQAQQDCLDKMLGGVTALKTINTLTEKLTLSEELREIERNRNRDSELRMTEMCNESKDRILAGCRK